MKDFPYEKLLDWPFLSFLILVMLGLRFHKQLAERLSSISELTIGGKTKIKLGSKEIDAQNIGDALTQAFQDLEARVEAIEAANIPSAKDNEDMREEATEGSNEVPDGLRDLLWTRVYKMLNSDYWYARYVDTLAKNTATSEQLMLSFLKERPDVDVFKDGDRWAASLRSRSRKPTPLS